jgi:hypothetical protein
MLYKSHFPYYFFGFQELEYIRSYLFGRMGEINGLLLVSGGLGTIKKQSLRRAGTGIGRLVELITRMRKLMHQKKGEVLDNIHSRTSLLD